MKRIFVVIVFLVFCFTAAMYAQSNFIYAKNGRLYHPNGDEVALWGVNLQPMLSWEYNSLLRRVGVEKETDTLHYITDKSLDELELLGSRVIRCHLTPADFTDAEGDLQETVFLDALDYMVAEASKRKMYLYITFINHMGSGEVHNSFMHGNKKDRIKWIFDEEFVKKSQNYITQLLNRENIYNGIQYKSDTAIAVWEISNEPRYLEYKDVKDSNYEKPYRKWLRRRWKDDDEENFRAYREAKVNDYINEMYRTIRKTGARQPVSWCCNWHKMIIGHEDVFAGIADSKVEVVSFCNYPGQSVVKYPYQKNPEDLTRHDYSDWYVDCYSKEEYYGWALTKPFMKKAKIVYEFETFYNQSAYLYPVMADFFKSMGVQIATIWHYSMPAYATYRKGSHVLNLQCTPDKSASFAVAGKIFEETPLYLPYHVESTTEWKTDKFAYSYKDNMSFFSDENSYFYSASIDDSFPIKAYPSVSEIFGYGNSPLVEYTGNSNYQVYISENVIDIFLHPDVRYLIELWDRNKPGYGPATLLRSKEGRTMKLYLEGWDEGNYTLFKVEDGKNIRKGSTKVTQFFATPGHYKIIRNTN